MTLVRMACPKCRQHGRDRAGDNLALYDDGHKFCYSCGYREGVPLRERIEISNVSVPTKANGLPEDFSANLSPEAANWLRKNGIIAREVQENGIGWSASRQLLIFPIYDGDGNVIAWQGRNFKTKKQPLVGGRNSQGELPSPSQIDRGYEVVRDGPKYLTFGPVRDIIHVIRPAVHEFTDMVVLVEGVVDAIKVGRRAPAMPLFGAHVPMDTVRRLARQFKAVGIWLDSDKVVEAVKSAIRASQFVPTFVVHTAYDPKEYNTDALPGILRGASHEKLGGLVLDKST